MGVLPFIDCTVRDGDAFASGLAVPDPTLAAVPDQTVWIAESVQNAKQDDVYVSPNRAGRRSIQADSRLQEQRDERRRAAGCAGGCATCGAAQHGAERIAATRRDAPRERHGCFHQPDRTRLPVAPENSVRNGISEPFPAIDGCSTLDRMGAVLFALLTTVRDAVRQRAALEAELLALRHQLLILQRQRGRRRVQLRATDRLLWVALARVWSHWRDALTLVKPETVISWHRRSFRCYWRWKSGARPCGRPGLSPELIELIKTMHQANPTWGAPRIHGELLKLGIEVAESTVSKYLPRRRRPPSQGWRTFLRNHLSEMVAVDFAVVPTVTGALLFAFVVLSLVRRRVLHVNVTSHPTAAWTAQQMVEALPWTPTARYVIRDRDGVYGEVFKRRVEGLGLQQVLIAARSPWQNAYAERFIGSLCRECLDHVVALDERHLLRVVRSYVAYYNRTRTHLALGKDPPDTRSVQAPTTGLIVAVPEVAGLHHRYERRAAG
jgi:putative transposase